MLRPESTRQCLSLVEQTDPPSSTTFIPSTWVRFILHSPFSILHSSFFILHSSFSILHSFSICPSERKGLQDQTSGTRSKPLAKFLLPARFMLAQSFQTISMSLEVSTERRPSTTSTASILVLSPSFFFSLSLCPSVPFQGHAAKKNDRLTRSFETGKRFVCLDTNPKRIVARTPSKVIRNRSRTPDLHLGRCFRSWTRQRAHRV